MKDFCCMSLIAATQAEGGLVSVCGWTCVFAVDKILFMKWLWPLRNGGATYCVYLQNCILHTCIRPYLHTNLLLYFYTCLLLYFYTGILEFLHTCILAYLLNCILAYLYTCILAYLHVWILENLNTSV